MFNISSCVVFYNYDLSVSRYFHVPIHRMGQLMEKEKPSLTLPIRIIALEAKIDSQPTIIDEKNSAVLKYRTPHFRAAATIQFPPLAADEHWKIGWIQACTRMDFINTYGDLGYSSWEIPPLISGERTMISDADGRNYPFYGSNSELIELKGPSTDYQTIQVRMNDNFYPHITWDLPMSNEKISRLTHVRRDQHFYTWLVAMNTRNGSILVLKTIRWQMNLEIDVDPKENQGSRAKLVSNPIPMQPEILHENVRIPSSVLYPPNANSAQMLVWYPDRSKTLPEIIVPPRCLSILNDNPYYHHYIRHPIPTTKLNSSHSKRTYSRVIYPLSRNVAQGILVR